VKTLPVKLKRSPYKVLVGHGLLTQAGGLCLQALDGPPSIVLVRCFWGRTLEKSLQESALDFRSIEIDDAETSKNINSIEHLLTSFSAAGADRSSVVLALGGGVIGDVAGFAASVYMRGIRVVQIPTTLLAQVDASIGGKTGINLRAGKNLAGTFHQPSLVIADPEVLRTLNEREFRSGIFEVIKAGAIRSKSLFEYVTERRDDILRHEKKALVRIVTESAKIKIAIVAEDEREAGLRRVLNFGHTVGHALEAATGYQRYLHGEAVGWGMVAAAYMGVQHGTTSQKVAASIAAAVNAFGPLPEANLTNEQLRPCISADKKTRFGIPHFVLLKEIGQTVIADDVSEISLEHGLQAMRNASALRGVAHG
jgi:3-dehydroquinate synthase